MIPRRTLVTPALLALACACGRVTPAGEGVSAALMTNLARARDLEVVVEEHALREPLERAAFRLRGAVSAVRFDAHLVDAASPPRASVPRVVVGTRASSTAQRLAARAGVQITGDAAHPQFTCAGQSFADPGNVVIATFEDPDRPGLPVSVVFGNDARAVALHAVPLDPAWKPMLRVFRGQDLVARAELELDGRLRADALEWLGPARRALRADLEQVAGEVGDLDVCAARGADPLAIARYCASCRSARQRVAAWCSAGTALPFANLLVRLEVEEYLADGDPNALSCFDPIEDRTEALVLGELDDGGAAVARAGAHAALGAPSQPWMEDAAGVEAAWSWWGRDLDSWLAHTGAAGERLGCARLVAADAGEAVSAHVLAPRRAALWRCLRESRGDAFVRELWRGTRALELGADLDLELQAWIATRLASSHVDHPGRRGLLRRVEHGDRPMRGIGTCSEIAADGGSTRRGYGTRAFGDDLDAAVANGADALLVTSFTRDEAGIPPRFGDERWRLLAPREGDVRIVSALRAGLARNMRTLLAPHFVTGDGGTWIGGWTRPDRAQWEAFFERYAAFVEHQGLLAELGGATVLSIGTGLLAVSSTDAGGRRTNPSEAEWKQAGWTRVIAAARAAFPGFLTYSACNVQEVEAVAFFGDLDYVGFELAPLLAEWSPPVLGGARGEMGCAIDAELAALERAARANKKKVLVTQACFSPALYGSARTLGSRSASREWQAQQFLDLNEHLRAWSGRDQLAGLFAWRFAGEAGASEHDPVFDTPGVRAAVRELLLGL